jgi:hypothetical protein
MSAIPAPALPEAAVPPSESQIITGLQKTVSPSRLTLFLQCRLKFVSLRRPDRQAEVGGAPRWRLRPCGAQGLEQVALAPGTAHAEAAPR